MESGTAQDLSNILQSIFPNHCKCSKAELQGVTVGSQGKPACKIQLSAIWGTDEHMQDTEYLLTLETKIDNIKLLASCIVETKNLCLKFL